MVATREKPRPAAERAPDVRPRRLGRGVAAAALVALVAVSAAVRGWAALAVPSPWYIPDEVIYGELGRSLYEHGRFDILGGTPGFYGLVYPALVGLPLSLSDVELGYDLLRVLQAVLMSLVAVPVFLWGRTLMARGWALVAAALSLAAPGLAFAGFVMTEVVFYPVLCLAAWAMARALVVPSLANQAVVVAAVFLTAMTRLQAIVLAPAFFGAVALDVAFARTWLRGARRFLPAAGGFGAIGLVWAAVTLGSGGGALGAYSVTATETSYSVADVARFSLYHAADLLLVTAVLPVVALAILAVPAGRGRERSPEARAYVAVTVAITVVFVAAVGVFTSRWLDRLAERNLIALAPLLFLGFCLWLDRGAPRPRVATAVAAAGALALLAATPWDDLVTRAAQPDAFSTIPLRWMRISYPELDVKVVLLVGAVELLVLAVLIPRRARWLMPATVGALLAAASIPVTVEVTREARDYARLFIGSDARWIDRGTEGSVAYLYGGEQPWTGGAPVWVNLFWNRRVDRLYNLFGPWIAGPVPRSTVRPAADGRLLGRGGREADGEYAVASRRITLVGQPIAQGGTSLVLWRIEPPLRLSTRATGFDAAGALSAQGSLVVYDCRGGELRMTLRSSADQDVELVRDGRVVRGLTLTAGEPWSGSVPAAPATSPGPRTCRFAIRGVDRPLTAERFDFVRATGAGAALR